MLNPVDAIVAPLGVVATLAAGCAGLGGAAQAAAQDQPVRSYPVTIHTDVPYTAEFVLDIYVPDGPGPFPTAITFHGVTGGKAAMEPLVRPLAEQGWIVFNANWLAPQRPLDAAMLEWSFEAAGCALRFAGATARSYGGDGEPLTVVGLSAGGLAGALVSLSSEGFGDVCKRAAQPTAVSLFVGLEGAYLNAAEGTGGLAEVLRERPDLMTRLDPRTYVGGATDLRVVLFLGDEFPAAVPGTESFLDSLRGAAVPVEIRRAVGPHSVSTFIQGVLELLRARL
jgi:acetyl esterase/lipase